MLGNRGLVNMASPRFVHPFPVRVLKRHVRGVRLPIIFRAQMTFETLSWAGLPCPECMLE
jgi:hypothetical protein